MKRKKNLETSQQLRLTNTKFNNEIEQKTFLQKYSTPHAYAPHILNKIINLERDKQVEVKPRKLARDDIQENKEFYKEEEQHQNRQEQNDQKNMINIQLKIQNPSNIDNQQKQFTKSVGTSFRSLLNINSNEINQDIRNPQPQNQSNILNNFQNNQDLLNLYNGFQLPLKQNSEIDLCTKIQDLNRQNNMHQVPKQQNHLDKLKSFYKKRIEQNSQLMNPNFNIKQIEHELKIESVEIIKNKKEKQMVDDNKKQYSQNFEMKSNMSSQYIQMNGNEISFDARQTAPHRVMQEESKVLIRKDKQSQIKTEETFIPTLQDIQKGEVEFDHSTFKDSPYQIDIDKQFLDNNLYSEITNDQRSIGTQLIAKEKQNQKIQQKKDELLKARKKRSQLNYKQIVREAIEHKNQQQNQDKYKNIRNSVSKLLKQSFFEKNKQLNKINKPLVNLQINKRSVSIILEQKQTIQYQSQRLQQKGNIEKQDLSSKKLNVSLDQSKDQKNNIIKELRNTSESLVTTLKNNMNSQDQNGSQRAHGSNKNSHFEKYFNAKFIDQSQNFDSPKKSYNHPIKISNLSDNQNNQQLSSNNLRDLQYIQTRKVSQSKLDQHKQTENKNQYNIEQNIQTLKLESKKSTSGAKLHSIRNQSEENKKIIFNKVYINDQSNDISKDENKSIKVIKQLENTFQNNLFELKQNRKSQDYNAYKYFNLDKPENISPTFKNIYHSRDQIFQENIKKIGFNIQKTVTQSSEQKMRKTVYSREDNSFKFNQNQYISPNNNQIINHFLMNNQQDENTYLIKQQEFKLSDKQVNVHQIQNEEQQIEQNQNKSLRINEETIKKIENLDEIQEIKKVIGDIKKENEKIRNPKDKIIHDQYIEYLRKQLELIEVKEKELKQNINCFDNETNKQNQSIYSSQLPSVSEPILFNQYIHSVHSPSYDTQIKSHYFQKRNQENLQLQIISEQLKALGYKKEELKLTEFKFQQPEIKLKNEKQIQQSAYRKIKKVQKRRSQVFTCDQILRQHKNVQINVSIEILNMINVLIIQADLNEIQGVINQISGSESEQIKVERFVSNRPSPLVTNIFLQNQYDPQEFTLLSQSNISPGSVLKIDQESSFLSENNNKIYQNDTFKAIKCQKYENQEFRQFQNSVLSKDDSKNWQTAYNFQQKFKKYFLLQQKQSNLPIDYFTKEQQLTIKKIMRNKKVGASGQFRLNEKEFDINLKSFSCDQIEEDLVYYNGDGFQGLSHQKSIYNNKL